MADPAWAPSVDQVAGVIPTRALAETGTAATFTGATRPSDAQVYDLIGHVVGEVDLAVGLVPEVLVDHALSVATLGAASLVELTYFAEQIGTGQSAYTELDKRYRLGIRDLVAAKAALAGGGSVGEVAGVNPVSCFPEPLIGWGTGF